MPLIERLENRTLLAGNVTANIVNGNLQITGDSAANAVEIRGELLDARSLMVMSGSDDTTINGLQEPAFFSGLTGHVIVRLGLGNDSLHVANADLPRDLRVEMGGGNDLFTSTLTTIRRNLGVSGNSGNDRILPNTTRVLRLTTLSGNDGNDTFIIAGDRFEQRLSVLCGAGNDLIDRFQTNVVEGSIVDGGTGDDVLNWPGSPTAIFDFNGGRRGWRSGFADWRRSDRNSHQFIAEPRPLPTELGLSRQGYLLSGDNKTDDLFMFIARTLTTTEGIVPNQQYMVEFAIDFASNATTGGFGVGGSAGDSVYLKAGASSVAPSVSLDEEGLYRLNLDMGQQASGGRDLSVVSTIANGLTADQVPDPDNPPYRGVRRIHVHPTPVSASADGKLHLVVGIDSGFEATTAIYFQRITVRLVPVVAA